MHLLVVLRGRKKLLPRQALLNRERKPKERGKRDLANLQMQKEGKEKEVPFEDVPMYIDVSETNNIDDIFMDE